MPNLSVGRMRVNGVIDPGLVTISKDGEGMETLNFPVKALREQILDCVNCLPGGEFVPASEIRKVLNEWNGKPITIDHPRDTRGRLEFANRDPEFLESVKVGVITNARWINGFLWVDAHLDRVLAATTVEGRGIIGALLGGGPDVEISTGYGMELEFRSGSFEGQRFHFAQSDIQPDHLALLPVGMAGACSIEDGCGAARAAQSLVAARDGGDTVPDQKKSKVDAIVALVKGILGMQELLTEDGDPAANADPDATKPPVGDTEPGEPGGTPHSQEDETMDRDALILALVAATSVDFSKEELEAFNDERLSSLATLAGCDCKDPPKGNAEGDGSEGADPPKEPAANPDGGALAITPEQLKALDAVVAFAERIPAMEALVSNAQETADAEREELVATLDAIEQCVVGKGDLEALPLTVLRGMKRSFEAVDYSGQGGPRSLGITEDDDGGYMPLPDISPVKVAGSGGDA